MEIKAPLEIDYDNESVESIMEKIEYAIEQHPSFLKVIPKGELENEEQLNKNASGNLFDVVNDLHNSPVSPQHLRVEKPNHLLLGEQ